MNSTKNPSYISTHTRIEPGLVTVTLTIAQVAELVAGLRAATETAASDQAADGWQMMSEYWAACAVAAEALRRLEPGAYGGFERAVGCLGRGAEENGSRGEGERGR